MSEQITRRRAIQGSLGVGVALSNVTSSSAIAASPVIADGKDARVVLFQGDSITDAGRDRKRQNANDGRSLGRGYPHIVASGLLTEHPSHGFQIHNRGISGNKVPDLQKRWKEDCLDLKPDVLSILIGVNDIWHKLNGRYDGTVQTYDQGYRDLLKQTQDALPDTKIVICEPFVLRCGAVTDKWFPEFDQRREVAVEIAEDLKLTLVPFQQIFNKAVTGDVSPSYWAGDGVHPSVAGHGLMAKTWREVVGL